MLFEEIHKIVQREVRTQICDRLKNKPPEFCTECRRRLTVVEKGVKVLTLRMDVQPEPPKRKKVCRVNGESLRRIRTRLEITQEEIALLLDVTLTSINRWERAKMIPSAKMKARISELRLLGKREAKNLISEKRKANIASKAECGEIL